MRKSFLLFLLFASFSLLAYQTVERPFLGDKRPKRSIKISNASTIKLKSNENIDIVVTANSSVQNGAWELRKYLEKILNAKVTLVTNPHPNKITFFLGISKFSKAAKIDDSILCQDSYIIKRIKNQIFILGKDDNRNVMRSDMGQRATLFGVYDFLERFCGARFYFYDEDYIYLPKLKELALPEIDIFERPDFEFRRVQIYQGIHGKETNFASKTFGRMKWNNMLRLQTKDVPNCHGLAFLSNIERFGKSHPEYFALLSNGKRHNNPAFAHPGQLCFSSNIRNEIYLDAKACLTGQKAITRNIKSKYKGEDWPSRHIKGKFFNIMPQDGMIPCNCASCKPIFQQPTEQAASDFIWKFVAEVGNKLKQEKVPGYLTMMTYHYYRHVPNVDLPDNLVVMFANHGPWALNTAQYNKDRKRLTAWNKKLKDKVYLWTYVNKFGALSMPGIPHSTPLRIGKYVDDVKKDVYGAFLESETDFSIFNMLNYYVFSKVAWDNSVNTKALLDEFYTKMFGKAAPYIKDFFVTIEDKWVKEIAGRIVETPLGPTSIPPSNFELWNKVYSPQVIGQLDAKLKQAAKSVRANSLEAKNIALIRRDFLKRIEDASKNYRLLNAVSEGQKFYISNQPDKEILLLPWSRTKISPTATKVKTTVKAWRTNGNFVVQFDCEEPFMSDVIAQNRKQDDKDIWMDNCVEIFLNPSNDLKTYYQILVNSNGSFSDQKTIRKGASGYNDFKWNSNLKLNVKKELKRWVATIEIPLKSLDNVKDEFRINFTRSRILKNTKNYVTYYQSSKFAQNFHDLDNYGRIIYGKEPLNLLLNGDFSAKSVSNRTFGIYKAGKWQGGWIAEKNKFTNKSSLDFSEQVSLPAAIKMEGENAMLLQYLPTLKPNTKYRLSYYVKLKDVKALKRGGGVCVNLFDDRNRWFPNYNYFTGSNDWIYQSFEFTTGKNANVKIKPYLRLRIFNAKGTAWFDDVKLEEI
jgi:hypothetical protein